MKDLRRLRMKKDTLHLLVRVRELFAQRSVEGYLGGGFIRDALVGREVADIDVIAAARAMELAPQLARDMGGRFVPLDEVNEIARVVLGGGMYLDISTMRGAIEEDLAQRDFTVNAIAISIKDIDSPSAPLIDPFGGVEDLRRGVVRSLGEEAFRRDPARLLRGPRIAAEFGFFLDGETKTQIRRNHQLIAKVAAERVRDEFCRLLAAPRAARWLRLLDELGLLEMILPELVATKGSEQPKEHFWDVFEHSIETVAAVEFLLRMGDGAHNKEALEFAPWSAELERHFAEGVGGGHDRRMLLKLAALLHDIAKPQTRSVDEGGRIRFLGHAKQGAFIARGVMERLRFSAREREMVEKMVAYHLRPAQMAGEGPPTRRAIYRYFRDTGEVAIDTIFLNLADHLATRGPDLELEGWRDHAEMLASVIEQRFREESIVLPPKLIDGHDLIEVFGLKPGPKLGELLEVVREAQAAGEVNSRDEAFSFVKRRLRSEP